MEKYNLDFDGKNFLLTSKLTACLALDACGIPADKPTIKYQTYKATFVLWFWMLLMF